MLSGDEIVQRIEDRVHWLKVIYTRRESTDPRHVSDIRVAITQLEALLEKCEGRQQDLLIGLTSLGISILS